MSHRFASIPKLTRVFIDTNVLLSAVFIEDGLARRAIEVLRKLGKTVYCDEISFLEARRRLDRARHKLHLEYDPVTLFDRLLPPLSLIFLPPGDPSIPSGIHRHDRHIPRAAKQFDTWVVTDDLDLEAGLLKSGIEARNSFEIIEAAYSEGVLPKFKGLAPRIQPLPRSGHKRWVIAWVTPGAWATISEASGLHTVVDIPTFGRILYDTATKAWRALFHFGAEDLSIPCPLASDVSIGIGVGFDSSRVPPKLFIGTGSPRMTSIYKTVFTTTNIPPFGLAGVSLGSTLAGTDHWGGYLRRLSIGSRFISKDTWKQITSIDDFAPHPQLDVLDQALVALNRLTHLEFGAARTAEL